MGLKFDIDVESLASKFGAFKRQVQEDLTTGVRALVGQIDGFIRTKAQEELTSTRKIFQDNYSVEEVGPGLWVFTVKKPALFIEEGLQENYDMKQALLKGKKSRVIPFDYGKAPSQQASYQKDVRSEIKKELGKRNISMTKIENNPDGSPKLGKLHSFDFGGSTPGKGNTPVMKGVSIYQSAKGGNVRRDVLTFRTVSSGPASAGKWIHPGMKGKKYLDQAHKQAMDVWEQQILPAIFEKWK